MMEVRVTFVPQDGLRRQAADSKALKVSVLPGFPFGRWLLSRMEIEKRPRLETQAAKEACIAPTLSIGRSRGATDNRKHWAFEA
jgi:hypothetical protein